MCLYEKRVADYSVLLCATVICDAAGEVSVTGGTPVLQVFFLLPADNADKQQPSGVLTSKWLAGKKTSWISLRWKTKKNQSDACFECFLKRTHLWLLPVESHVLVAATWPGMHCSYVGSPSSSAGGKHCSYDSWSSGINKTARLNKILVLSTTACVQYVQPTCWLWQVMPQR